MPAAEHVIFSRTLLESVAAGTQPETFRVHRSQPAVAFGRQDMIHPGYEEAKAAAIRHGFEPLERLAGGRAAVFHHGTLAFAWTIPSSEPRTEVERRFSELAEIMTGAFRTLGVEAMTGEVPGEYCPGRWSVNIRGEKKVMGVGQRLIRGAAHVGGVVVVSDSASVVRVLTPVYQALEMGFDPATVGALDEEIEGIGLDTVTEAIRRQLARRFDLY